MADRKNINEKLYLAEQRRKAEAKLAERRKNAAPLPLMEVDAQRLMHELEVHQIELEMQNEELWQARAEREAALDQYTDLYDFAPIGYFTLTRDGTIRKVNLSGAKLLGVERTKLLEKRFGLFVADQFRTTFIDFLESVFAGEEKKSLDVMLGQEVGEPRWVLIEAVCNNEKKECRAAVTDITERKQAEEKLRHSEARFKALADNTPDHILIHDSELKYTMVINPQLGLTEKDMLGKTDHDLFPHEEADPLVEAKQQVMASGKPLHFETSLTSLTGEPEFFDGTYIPTFDEQSQPNGLIGYFRNVTESKQAEAEIIKQKNIAENYLNIAGNIVLALNREGEITLLNKKGHQILGYEEGELYGKDWFSTCLPKEIDPEIKAYFKDLVDGKVDGQEIYENEVIRKDGEKRFLRWFNTLVRDDTGNITGLLSSGEDFTEQKLSADKLRESQERFDLAMQASRDGLFDWNLETNEIYYSPGWKSMLGYEYDEIPNDFSIWETNTHPEDVKRSWEMQQELIDRKRDRFELEFRMKHKDGYWVDILSRAEAQFDKNGKAIRIIGTHVDITERKEIEVKLLNNQKRYTKAQAMGHVGNWEYDPVTTKFWGSDEAKRIYGFDPDAKDFTTDNVESCIPERARVHQALMDLLEEDKKYDLAFDILTHDKRIRKTIHSIAELERDARGNPLKVTGVISDITERMQSQIALKQYTSQLETLNTTTVALSSSLELDKVLNLILTQIGNVIPFDSGAIFLYEKDGLRVVSEFGITPSIKGEIFPAENELFQKIQETQQPLIVNNVSDDARFQNWGKSVDLGSWMGVPLFVRDSLIGNLTIDSVQPDAYSPEQAKLALSFAFQAAQAIENARLFQDATQRLARMDSLRKIDRAITSSFDLKVTLNILFDQLQEKLEVDAVAVLLYENAGQTLSFFQGQGFQTAWIRHTNLHLDQGYAGKVASGRRDIFVQNLNQSEMHNLRSDKIKEEGFLSYYGVPLIAKGQLIGVLEIFQRSLLNPSLEWISFLQTLAGQAAIAVDNITLFKNLQSSNANLNLAYESTIEGWAQALELRDMETEGHSRRVVLATIGVAKALGYRDENLAHIRRGALLHDIGKMGIPDAILQKKDALTEDEWQVMREHPVYAYQWLSSIDYLKPALDIPYCHHEKWDGTGYPRGLAGKQIPLEARIFAVVDVWDALRSDRPYRKAWSQEKTLAYIQAESAKHFDPQVVAAFIKYLDESGTDQ